MKLRLRPSTRISPRLKRKLRAVAVIATFASLIGITWFLYEFIGNVTTSRAEQIEAEKHPATRILEGFAGRKKITVDPEKIAGKGILTDFIVPVCLRDDDLKVIEQGGQVFSKEGNDLVFTAADGFTVLPFQVERYEPESGKLTAWVRFDSLSASGKEAIFYLYFGNAQQVTAETAATFATPFESVWHFNSSFQNSGTADIAGEYKGVKDEEGRFAGAKDFLAAESGNASFSFIDKPVFTGNVTVSAWIRPGGTSFDQLIYADNGKKGGCSLGIDKNGKLIFEVTGSAGQTISVRKVNGGISLQPKQWYSVTGIYDASSDSLITYVNGKKDRGLKGGINYLGGERIVIGSDAGMCHAHFNGVIDELRISSRAFSGCYIQTAYKAESAPEQFITVDGKEVFSASPRIAKLSSFEATVEESHVSVNWQTKSESNLDYFTLERSTDGTEFDKVATQFASGNSDTARNYFLLDPAPVFGNAYYRLRFTGFKGESDVSNTLNVHYSQTATALGISKVEPNPFKDNFSVLYNSESEDPLRVNLTSISGQVVHTESVNPKQGSENLIEFKDTKHLHPGIYFLSLSQANEQKTVKLIKRL